MKPLIYFRGTVSRSFKNILVYCSAVYIWGTNNLWRRVLLRHSWPSSAVQRGTPKSAFQPSGIFGFSILVASAVIRMGLVFNSSWLCSRNCLWRTKITDYLGRIFEWHNVLSSNKIFLFPGVYSARLRVYVDEDTDWPEGDPCNISVVRVKRTHSQGWC